ncbi:MAG: alpha/beta hydrolase [Agarilytica sp.]
MAEYHMKNIPKLILLTLLALHLSIITSCSLKDIKNQSEAIEKSITITGNIDKTRSAPGVAFAVLLKEEGGVARWINDFRVGKDGKYTFYATPGNYIVGVFIDQNNDRLYQDDEPANYTKHPNGDPIVYTMGSGEVFEAPLLSVMSKIQRPRQREIIKDINAGLANVGAIASISDPKFDLINGKMGMWRPLDFVGQVGGGLFLLQAYEQEKIPVIFVHGMSGTPKNWARAIDGLDKEAYQPWVFYYPSGARLDMVSNFLLKSVNQLSAQYQFKEFYVAAHSMGGLVTRSFVKKYLTSGANAKLGKVITVNSPMNGMKSAETGVSRSPIVVPAWRDVATNSEFVSDLRQWTWPSDIPYYLAFSYLSGESGDGVVDLSSQIPRHLQKEAHVLRGFNAEHTEALSDPVFLKAFLNWLN